APVDHVGEAPIPRRGCGAGLAAALDLRGDPDDMNSLDQTATAFVEMAHRIVWATVATVDGRGRPRGRILHPYWVWDGMSLVGWIATGPTPVKRAGLEASPFVSVTYCTADHDTCTAECAAAWAFDDETRRSVWQLFKDA